MRSRGGHQKEAAKHDFLRVNAKDWNGDLCDYATDESNFGVSPTSGTVILDPTDVCQGPIVDTARRHVSFGGHADIVLYNCDEQEDVEDDDSKTRPTLKMRVGKTMNVQEDVEEIVEEIVKKTMNVQDYDCDEQEDVEKIVEATEDDESNDEAHAEDDNEEDYDLERLTRNPTKMEIVRRLFRSPRPLASDCASVGEHKSMVLGIADAVLAVYFSDGVKILWTTPGGGV